MANVNTIHPADLRAIENGLRVISDSLGTIDSNIGTVNDNVKAVFSELDTLTNEFRDFVNFQVRAGRKQIAHTELVRVRQELEKRFGHYDIVRRTTTGILQADDLGIVKRDTISTATEELMISTPGYWLAPCLVALAAWINDEPELAERALREGIRRNDEKTSLFFALVCRRADRRQASLAWTQRYLANQDEEDIDRKTVVILDAFASGLLGSDAEGVISRQLDEWLDRLSAKPGFIERQTAQWSDAILLKRRPFGGDDYTYLKKYSRTWPVLQDIMEGARLHADILKYFQNIFDQKESTDTLKQQLDSILETLVTDFDDEELPLRREEKYNQFIIDFDGDEARAKRNMAIEQTAFETHKDFTQMLTDAAMKPESSHSSASTQKFAIALTKDWIRDAYNDVTAQNRMKIPHEIEVNVDSFNSTTIDGDNEDELVDGYCKVIDSEKAAELDKYRMSLYDKFCLYGGGAIAALGGAMWMTGSSFLGIVVAIAGGGLVLKHFSRKKAVDAARANVERQFEEKRDAGTKIIRALCAETVDFRAEFEERDSESERVIDMLEQISPEQYIRKLSGTSRRINVKAE